MFSFFGARTAAEAFQEAENSKVFALFVDLMGVRAKLSAESTAAHFEAAISQMDDFRGDLESCLNSFAFADRSDVEFIAEFSDAAYLVSPNFDTLAAQGIFLMQRALRHEYPLRGGIGFGTFVHQRSGVSSYGSKQTWSTSSFLGSSIVNAYSAERCSLKGLRIFVHNSVTLSNNNQFVTPTLGGENLVNGELRIWDAQEAESAATKMKAFRNKQDLPQKVIEHYDETLESYSRFALDKRRLDYPRPNLWL